MQFGILTQICAAASTLTNFLYWSYLIGFENVSVWSVRGKCGFMRQSCETMSICKTQLEFLMYAVIKSAKCLFLSSTFCLFQNIKRNVLTQPYKMFRGPCNTEKLPTSFWITKFKVWKEVQWENEIFTAYSVAIIFIFEPCVVNLSNSVSFLLLHSLLFGCLFYGWQSVRNKKFRRLESGQKLLHELRCCIMSSDVA